MKWLRMDEYVAEMLKARREKKRLFQKEAASICGVHIRTYQGWEAGKYKPRELAMEEVIRRMNDSKP